MPPPQPKLSWPQDLEEVIFTSSEQAPSLDADVAELVNLDLGVHVASPLPQEDHHSTSSTLRRREASILSPLRYPGAKRRFAGYVEESLRCNELKPKLFVEPFAGGASTALQLLQNKCVESIGLAEVDPLVADFWQCVFFETDWLISEIERIEVTLATWDRFRNLTSGSRRDNALACLFLNRTSFSGILSPTAGPIGGRQQKSSYSIACRFPKATIAKRIAQAGALRDKVKFVLHAPWHDTLALCQEMQAEGSDIFIYLDPPFFKKASRLYRFYFEHEDHQNLHDELLVTPLAWLLSYDYDEEAKIMYSDIKNSTQVVELLYTASSKNQKAVKEFVVTNLPHLPHQTRLWRTSVEWNSSNLTLPQHTLPLMR